MNAVPWEGDKDAKAVVKIDDKPQRVVVNLCDRGISAWAEFSHTSLRHSRNAPAGPSAALCEDPAPAGSARRVNRESTEPGSDPLAKPPETRPLRGAGARVRRPYAPLLQGSGRPPASKGREIVSGVVRLG